jgi:hypothetical protein
MTHLRCARCNQPIVDDGCQIRIVRQSRDQAGDQMQFLAVFFRGTRRRERPQVPTQRASGSYIDQGKILQSSPASYETNREEELWRTAARLTGVDQKI